LSRSNRDSKLQHRIRTLLTGAEDVDSEPDTDFTPAFLPVLVRQPAWLLAFWRFDFGS